MVKVEIVEEKDANASPYASSDSSRTGSSASLSSVDSDASVDESFFDRIVALKDIVPPTTRHNISTRVAQSASIVKRGGKLLGNIIWVLTTSTLLIGLPLALIIEDEAKAEAQEKEMLEQQQGVQQVGLPYSYPFPLSFPPDDCTYRVERPRTTRFLVPRVPYHDLSLLYLLLVYFFLMTAMSQKPHPNSSPILTPPCVSITARVRCSFLPAPWNIICCALCTATPRDNALKIHHILIIKQPTAFTKIVQPFEQKIHVSIYGLSPVSRKRTYNGAQRASW